MSLKSSTWPRWAVALVLSALGASVCALVYLVVPELGSLHVASRMASLRILACASVAFAALLYASFIDEQPRHGPPRTSRLQPIPTGAVAGLAWVFMFSLHPTPDALLLGSLAGIVLSVLGVSGFVARGL